jgi:ferritin-like metal-binding protein YciE
VTLWAVTTLVVISLLTTSVGALVGAVFSGLGGVVSSAGSTVATAATTAAPALEATDPMADETQGQIEGLEQVFEIIGKPARGKTCEAIQGIVAEGE